MNPVYANVTWLEQEEAREQLRLKEEQQACEEEEKRLAEAEELRKQKEADKLEQEIEAEAARFVLIESPTSVLGAQFWMLI